MQINDLKPHEMRGTDFTKRNVKDVLVIRLGDEDENFDVRLMVPTKGIHDDLMKAAELVDAVMEGGEEAPDCMGQIYAFVCRAMSHNTDARRITPEFLDKMGFTLSDAALFIGDYMQFMLELATQKN